MSLEHQHVVVTGASSGIGKAQCEAFLEEGAYVFGIDCAPCPIHHANFTFQQCDISNEAEVSALTQAPVDILCNTAGVLDDFLPSDETPLELFDRVMGINVRGTFLVTNHFLPTMLSQGKGNIINMASIASVIPGGGGASYTASKHAILGYTKQLAYDYAHRGIRVNAIGPGAIDTPMNRADFVGDNPICEAVKSQVPQHRYAKPEEVAQLSLFLASEKSAYICGDFIPIDGGWINRNIPL